MNLIDINKKLDHFLNERFDQDSVLEKDLAILYYLSGLINLGTSYTVTELDIDNKYMRIEDTWGTYFIEVENGEAYLLNIPDAMQDTIQARVKLNYKLGTLDLSGAIADSEDSIRKLVSNMDDVDLSSDVSLMLRDILDINNKEI